MYMFRNFTYEKKYSTETDYIHFLPQNREEPNEKKIPDQALKSKTDIS